MAVGHDMLFHTMVKNTECKLCPDIDWHMQDFERVRLQEVMVPVDTFLSPPSDLRPDSLKLSSNIRPKGDIVCVLCLCVREHCISLCSPRVIQYAKGNTGVWLYYSLPYSQGSLCKIGAFHFLARLVASKPKQSAVSCLQSAGLPPDMHFLHLAILIKKEVKA